MRTSRKFTYYLAKKNDAIKRIVKIDFIVTNRFLNMNKL